MLEEPELLWEPSAERIAQAGITEFTRWINGEYKAELTDYSSLWNWSIEDVPRFWEALARHYGVFTRDAYEDVLPDPAMPGTRWFTGSKVNFAEYTLRQGADDRIAIFADSESVGARQLTWRELRDQVAHLATHMRDAGIKPGDHVCAYLPISCEAVVGLLAAASIGAVWSSCSPDFGTKSVVERFSQVSPKLLIAISGYHYNGKYCDRTRELDELVSELGSLEEIIYLPWADRDAPVTPRPKQPVQVTSWTSALDNSADYHSFSFDYVAFDHPIWVLYTSGTTGLPKGIVHGHGGVLLEFIKAGRLHDDLDPDSVKFYFTTTGWTMFNLLVGGLVAGSAIVVYDGCPTYPSPGILFELAERYGVTYFGTSPTFVNSLIAAAYSPRESRDLRRIRTIALTGSPASPETFKWFYENLHSDLHIVSMSGGTDVAAAFVGGAPTLPVYAGEIQAPCLAVEARAFDEAGNSIVDEDGELVILQPMPSMPLYFINDSNYERYRSSYFDMYQGIWRQGDLIRFRADGRCIISGRSDSTLNRFGVRVGTSEIYRTVEAIDGIEDSLIVNLELPDADFFMPLFVVLEAGVELDTELKTRICADLKTQCSPRHVPDDIFAIEEVPYTLSGKKLEVPIKKLLAGKPLESSVNPGSCRNPHTLDYFVNFARTMGKRNS